MDSEQGGTETRLPAILRGFDLTDQQAFTRGIPYALFARLRSEAPLFLHPPGQSVDGEPFWVLTRHADITAAAADPAYSAQGGGGRQGGGSHLDDLEAGGLPGVLFGMMDDPRHALVRALLLPWVTGQEALGREKGLRELAAELTATAVARKRADFMAEVAEEFAILSMALLLGVPKEDWAQLLDWGRSCLGFLNRRTGLPDERSVATFEAMQGYFTGLLEAKRARPGHDIATVLATGDIAHEGGAEPPLSAAERAVNLTVLMVTGLEQPRNTIAGAVLAFAEHPEQWQALRADRSLMPTAIEEVLRWNPPNPYNRRTATRDMELHGRTIKAGDKVTFWWPAANRDPSVFPDPDRFDIRRDPNPHVSFGHGTHYCLGDETARLQIRLVLEELLERAAHIEPAGEVVWGANNKHTVLLDVPLAFTAASR
ncbi:cytochrome P450 [Streptomyces sp. P6-2-1]|uniref:cytochrome P450 n=1 Tax=Streptomyces sp. P6-2-1 TaxID=3422591 RepID=UPI003D36DADD